MTGLVKVIEMLGNTVAAMETENEQLRAENQRLNELVEKMQEIGGRDE